MRSWRLDGSPSVLVARESLKPSPGAGEVLIRVKAAGVTPTELQWYPTTHTKSGEKRSDAIPGHEFTGIIEAVGAGAVQFKVGEEIFGMNDWFADGATAEYCISKPDWIAPKPSSFSHAEAASVPIGALTAWQGLYDRAKIQSGEHVLIHGGSGAVGVYAIQLARRAGAKIITTASARNRDFLLQMGADRVIDYHAEKFEQIVSNMDVVLDTVGGSTLQRSWGVLKPTGRMVTIASDSEGTADERTRQAFFIVDPNQRQLVQIGNLLHSKQLQTVIDAEVPWEKAADAYAGKIAQRSGRGKVVVVID
jgi:NADPH:quinone reductase-like Zn-dependent oxidoreductase